MLILKINRTTFAFKRYNCEKLAVVKWMGLNDQKHTVDLGKTPTTLWNILSSAFDTPNGAQQLIVQYIHDMPPKIKLAIEYCHFYSSFLLIYNQIVIAVQCVHVHLNNSLAGCESISLLFQEWQRFNDEDLFINILL